MKLIKNLTREVVDIIITPPLGFIGSENMKEFKIGDVVKITDGQYKGLVGIIDGEKQSMRDFLTHHELTRYPVKLRGPNNIRMMFSRWDLSLVDENKEGICELRG